MNDEEKTVEWLLAAPTDVQLNNRAMALFVRYNYPQWERIMKRAMFELYSRIRVQE
jgi:hypothetical protein